MPLVVWPPAVFAAISFLLAASPAVRACWTPPHHIPRQASRAFHGIDACSDEEREWQANMFVKKGIAGWGGTSSCAPHWWLLALAERQPHTPKHFVLADVGCNKGYFSGTALNAMAPHLTPNHLAELYRSHTARGVYAKPCGGCDECREEPQRPAPGAGIARRSVAVHCVEPSLVHVDSMRLALASGAYVGAAAAGVQWTVVHAAMANYTGTAQFATGCTHNECSLRGAAQQGPTQPVNVTTLDCYMADAQLNALDVLKVDTEGFDPAVLAGAYHALAEHRVRALVFEYHSFWERSGGSLQQCVAYLRELGYACYYDTAHGQGVRLSGSCWDHRYETRTWTNVVCAVQGSALNSALMEGSLLGASRRAQQG